MTEQMDIKRELLNRLVENARISPYNEEIIAASREMDELISQYYRDSEHQEIPFDKSPL